MDAVRSCCGALAVLALVIAVHLVPASGANWEEYDGSLASNQDVILRTHNEVRRNVMPSAANMLRMEWSTAAQASALEWVQTCNFFHRTTEQLDFDDIPSGENILFSNTLYPWDEAIKVWVDEVNNPGFDYGKGLRNPGIVGHYTQVIWYSTYQVGCAINYCPEKAYKYMYLCEYRPTGNWNNRLTKPYDEGPSCQDCPNDCDDKLCTNPCPYLDNYINCWLMKMILGCGTTFFGQYTMTHCPATCQCTNRIH
ncbi:cysteine-rich venom protein TEL1-like [Lampetra fluviatilis]